MPEADWTTGVGVRETNRHERERVKDRNADSERASEGRCERRERVILFLPPDRGFPDLNVAVGGNKIQVLFAEGEGREGRGGNRDVCLMRQNHESGGERE